jgi:hypothetical protein
LKKGARPSDSVRTLLSKHLSRDLSAVKSDEAPGTGPQAPAEAPGPRPGA